MFGFPGYLWPWNAIYMLIAMGTWLYLQPALERCVEFRVDWIAEMYVRNIAMLIVIAGAWHVYFYRFKAQGTRYKYTSQGSLRQIANFCGAINCAIIFFGVV